MAPFFSIAIPSYEMNGEGMDFLDFSLSKINQQKFKSFEVVISDHSKNDDIKNLCVKWRNLIDIRYFKNKENRGSSSTNINFAMKQCRGTWIKILFQDDFLFHDNSLSEIEKFLLSNPKVKWLASACEHTQDGKTFINKFTPQWNDAIHLGVNTISSPSVICIKNEIISGDKPLLFNEELIWLMDVEFYRRLYDKYGPPAFLQDVGVVNRLGPHRLSSTIEEQVKAKEVQLMINLYGA